MNKIAGVIIMLAAMWMILLFQIITNHRWFFLYFVAMVIIWAGVSAFKKKDWEYSLFGGICTFLIYLFLPVYLWYHAIITYGVGLELVILSIVLLFLAIFPIAVIIKKQDEWKISQPSKPTAANHLSNTCATCGAQYDEQSVTEYNALGRCCHDIPDFEQKALWSYRINGNVPLSVMDEKREIRETGEQIDKKDETTNVSGTCQICRAEYGDQGFVAGYYPLERCCHDISDDEQKALWKHRINKEVPLNKVKTPDKDNRMKACTHCYSQVPYDASVCPNCGELTEPIEQLSRKTRRR